MQKDTLKAPIKIESYLLGPISNNIQEGFASTKPSIFLTAPNGINNKGKGVWCEEIELWVKGEEGKKCPLYFSSISHCLLLPRLNQSLQNKGLTADVIKKKRTETGKPAIHFLYRSRCNQNSFVQAANKAGVRIGTAAAIPHVFPQPAPPADDPSEPRFRSFA